MSYERDEPTSGAEAIIALIFCAILIGAIAWVSYAIESWKCEKRWPGKNAEYRWIIGCTVMTKDGMIPDKNFRVND